MMLHLTCDLRANGLNVLQYASKKGATKLLDEILRTPYVFMNPVTEKFDVTFLIPDTVPEPAASRRAGGGKAKQMSCLELIVNSRKEEQAEDVLAIYPLCELVRNYWVLCRRVYNVFLAIHIVFMTLFSIYSMPTSEFIATRFNLTISNASAFDESLAFRPDTVPLYGLFLLWPVIICFIELVDMIEFCYRAYEEATRSERKKRKRDSCDRIHAVEEEVGADDSDAVSKRLKKLLAVGRMLMLGFNYLSNISALLFSGSVFAWSALSTLLPLTITAEISTIRRLQSSVLPILEGPRLKEI